MRSNQKVGVHSTVTRRKDILSTAALYVVGTKRRPGERNVHLQKSFKAGDAEDGEESDQECLASLTHNGFPVYV